MLRPAQVVTFPRAAAALVASLLALVAAGSASADRVRVRPVAADQALAKKGVLQLGDLGGGSGWMGGATKPSPPASFACGSYRAKQSDLVQTGSAASIWRHSGLEFDSEAQVLRNARMVRLDWRRTVVHAGVTDCLRHKFSTSLPKGEKLVSFAPIAFPKVGAMTTAYRGVLDVREPTGSIRVFVDVVVFGAGRVELTLITTAPYSARTMIGAAEARLAQAMAARVQPGAA